MHPWEMVLAHRYAEAVDRYEESLKIQPDDTGLLAEHATALLNLGRLDLALTQLRRANALVHQEVMGESQPYLIDIGTILWLLGRREEAIQTLTASVNGILDRSIKFADNGGGVSQGLLLWYAGLSAPDEKAEKDALNYLRKLATKPRIKYWPGPLALFTLGKTSDMEVILEATGANELDDAIVRARSNLLKRRQLAKALFYFAVRKRDEGLEQECRDSMRACASLENPVLEPEWYLARAETLQPSR